MGHSGISWSILQGICTSLQTDNHANTSSLKFYTGQMLFLPRYQQHQSTERKELNYYKQCQFSWVTDQHENKPEVTETWQQHCVQCPTQVYWDWMRAAVTLCAVSCWDVVSSAYKTQTCHWKTALGEVRQTALAWPMTLTFNPLWATVTTYSHVKVQGQRQVT